MPEYRYLTQEWYKYLHIIYPANCRPCVCLLLFNRFIFLGLVNILCLWKVVALLSWDMILLFWFSIWNTWIHVVRKVYVNHDFNHHLSFNCFFLLHWSLFYYHLACIFSFLSSGGTSTGEPVCVSVLQNVLKIFKIGFVIFCTLRNLSTTIVVLVY